MTTKADFDADQWATMSSAPALAAAVVAAAERGGTLREGLALAKVYGEARRGGSGGLLDELLATPPAIGTPPADAAELRARGLAAVRTASDLLREQGTKDELREFGDFVLAVCDTVARAHREGGVLGFGGKAVSPAEQTAFDDVAEALGERPAAG